MLQRYLLIWLTLSSWIAFRWPDWSPIAWDPFVSSKPILAYLFAGAMFFIGMMLPREEVREALRRPWLIAGGTLLQFLAMPLLAAAAGKLAGLPEQDLIGLVIVGCVPGAMASNVLTLNARGDTAYSVGLTTSATLLSPLLSPLMMGLLLQGQNAVDTQILIGAGIKLLWTVAAPVSAGYLVARTFSSQAEQRVRRVGEIVANLAILWIIAAVMGLNRERLTAFRWELAGVLLAVNVGGYLSGAFGAKLLRLPRPMGRALTLEVGMQNAGLGATLALQLFPNQSGVALAPAMYTFGCMLTGTLLASWWRGRSTDQQITKSKTH